MQWTFQKTLAFGLALLIPSTLFSLHLWAQEDARKKTLTPQAFIQSEAGQLVQAKKYKEAVEALEELQKQYPDDILVRRYLGISYSQTGNFEAAVKTFREALQLDPENTAVHFYLGEAYAAWDRREEARSEYEFVRSRDALGRYGETARLKLETLEKAVPVILAAPPVKRWRLETEIGYEYDGNATFASRDPDLRTPEDQNAGRYTLETFATYELFSRGSHFAEAEYGYAQTLYDDNLHSLNTFVNSLALTWTHVPEWSPKPLIFQLRENLSHVILDDKFFVFVQALIPTVIYRPHPRTQISGVYAFTVSEFDDNTSDPEVGSRDGAGHQAIFLNTLYFNEARTLRLVIGYDYKHDKTRGGDFIRDVHGGRVGFHFPILARVEGEVDLHYSHDDRPDYKADTENGPRRDDIWEWTTSLERKLWEKVTLKLFFAYHRAYSKNNSFEYTRPYGGSSIHVEF